MSPNVFEINEVKIYKDKCCGEFYPMFFLVMLTLNARLTDQSAILIPLPWSDGRTGPQRNSPQLQAAAILGNFH